MPTYLFAREDRPDKTSTRFYHMNEVPSIGSLITDEDGVVWRRVATKPQASFDTKADPYSAKDYVKATAKRGTIGDLHDRAAEAAAKRADKEGKEGDPVQNAFYENYSKRRKGKKHPQQAREEAAKSLKDRGIRVDFGED